MHPLNKYIVHLGWAGFGDRLQALCHCILIAQKRNRILYTNWMDEHFQDSFWAYFNLTGIPYTKEFPAGDTYPKVFEHLRAPASSWIYDLKDYTLDQSNATVLVFSSKGTRTFGWGTLTNHLTLTEQTQEEVMALVKGLENLIGDLPLIHLRGTDRKWEKEAVYALAEKHGKAAITSDDNRAIDAYKEVADVVIINSGREDNQPIHKYNPARSRHIKMLTDLYLLHKYGKACLNDQSVFWRASQNINVSKWFRSVPAPEHYDGCEIIKE